MIRPSVARKYARALVEVAQRKGALPRVLEEVRSIEALAKEDRHFRGFLEARGRPEDSKKAVILSLLSRLFPEGTDTHTRNFFEVLALHHRLSDFLSIIEVLQEAVDEREGIVRARVTTAAQIGDEEGRAIGGVLEKATSHRVRVELDVDPKLLGGAVTQIGSTIYDGSVRTRLQKLKGRIASGGV